MVPLIRSFTSGTGSWRESGHPMFIANVTLPDIIPCTYRLVTFPVTAMVKDSLNVVPVPGSASTSSTLVLIAGSDVSKGSWKTGLVNSSSGLATEGHWAPPKANPPSSTPRTNPVGPRTRPPTDSVATSGPRSQT